MNTSQMIDELQQYLIDNYDEGGHWIYETYDRTDYEKILYECKGDLDEAVKELKARCELIEAQSHETKFE